MTKDVKVTYGFRTKEAVQEAVKETNALFVWVKNKFGLTEAAEMVKKPPLKL